MKKLLLPVFASSIIFVISVTAQDVMLLVPEVNHERQITTDETHVFEIDVPSDQFVVGEANQLTIDVVVTVYHPDGRLLDTFDSPARGPEPFQFESVQAGLHRIEVTPFAEETGQYVMQILLVEPVASTPEGKVDQLMAFYNKSTPGGVIAVIKSGDVVFSKGYGMANLEYGIPNTPHTPYHMASVSKQFTAFAVAMLADQGRLSLDDEIHKHFPELADFGQTITLRHLLTHTSGLRDQWNLWMMAGGRMDDVIRQEDLFRLIERQKELNFDPGAEYTYSNTGYMLLAEVVTRVAGEDFGDWMQEHVFGPLEMTSTQIYDDHERLVEGRAYSYANSAEGIKKAVLSYANAGATSLFTTAEDLAHWLRNFRTAEVGGPAVIEQMQERGVLVSGDTLGYALGIGIGTYRGLRRIQHGGADAGYRTMLTYYPEIDAGVVVLSNYGSFNTGQMANNVADAFFTEHMEPVEQAPADPVPEAGVTIASDLLDAYAGEYALNEGPILQIVRTDDVLYAQVEGQPRVLLTALADTLFRIDVPGEDVRISFHVEPDGSVERGTVHQQSDSPFRRIEPWEPDVESLASFTGKYDSPELETFYSVIVDGDQLVARHRRHGDITLTPTEEDTFEASEWFFGTVLFERDDAGRITGMRVSNGRVRNLLFEKQGE